MRSPHHLITVFLFALTSFPALAANTTIQENVSGTVPFINAGKSTDGATSSTALGLQVNGTEMMRITASGSVGIGVKVPASSLHVVGPGDPNNSYNLGLFSSAATATGANMYTIEIDKHNYAAMFWGINKDTVSGDIPANAAFISTWGSASPLVLGRGNDAGLPNKADIYISGAGKVGLGTSSPSTFLDVANADSGHTTAKLGNNLPIYLRQDNPIIGFNTYYDGTTWRYGAGSTSHYGSIITADAYNGGLLFQVTATPGAAAGAASLATAMAISKSGNVGIGTTSPSYLLHVNGTAYATGAAGSLSDARHKTGVKTLTLSGLETVAKLRPVSFLWIEPKDDGMKGEQMGFIAQEVEKVLPQIVLTEPNAEKTKGIKYTEMIPVLVKAVQELKAENDMLKARLDRIEGKNKSPSP